MSKTFEEQMAGMGAKQIGESGMWSIPPVIKAAYPATEVGTLAKYFYRIESDGQIVMVGFQTYEEMMRYIYAKDGDDYDEAVPFSTARLDHENQKAEQAAKDEYRAAVGKACFKDFCDKLIPIHFATVPFIADCGADVPNQRTTTIRENVTCEACKADEPTLAQNPFR